MNKLLTILAAIVLLGGCTYYGGAVPPDYPVSMDTAYDIARNKAATGAGERRIIKQQYTPQISQPTYIPEKELAVVAPPRTLLVWSYPFIGADNTRTFGSWSTIFLTERYEWLPPANEMPAN